MLFQDCSTAIDINPLLHDNKCWEIFSKTKRRRNNRDLVLQKDAGYTMEGACKQTVSFKKNRNKNDTLNHKVTVEISGAHHEERGLGGFETHKVY